MPRKSQPASLDGALVIDKPRGKTSHDVVEAVRRVVGFRQIGHLGTLDPLATGVLVLLLGRATRLAQFYVGRRKRYDSTFRFGFATDTYDADGEALGPDTAPQIDRPEIEIFVVPGGNFPTMSFVPEWERAFGKPVITTNQAALWAMMRIMKVEEKLPGLGQLLEQMPGR